MIMNLRFSMCVRERERDLFARKVGVPEGQPPIYAGAML